MEATERFNQSPARYAEASLVKKLEELGIGRPSTYAPTISTIQNRGYVVKEDRKGQERNYCVCTLKDDKISRETRKEVYGKEKAKLFPTDIGGLVNDFLVEYFSNILDYNFTASIEKEFDKIAEGQLEWSKMIDDFYPAFKDANQPHERTPAKTASPVLPRGVLLGRRGPRVLRRSDDLRGA